MRQRYPFRVDFIVRQHGGDKTKNFMEPTMSNIHVCLVSVQTIPNILSIHHFKPDEILFISTEMMRQKDKVGAIIRTLDRLGLDYKNRHETIEVMADNLLDCSKKIEAWTDGKEDADFSVNLTGGTKIMSIAAYEHFMDFGCRMIYIPIPKNEFITPYPIKKIGKSEPLRLRLGIAEYLTAYGLEIINENKLQHSINAANERKDISKWMAENYANLKTILTCLGDRLRNHRNEDSYNLTFKYDTQDSKGLELLNKMEFHCEGEFASKTLNKSEMQYLTGGWLEEFCFNSLNELKGKGIDDALININIRKTKTVENEFDVMFTKDNTLHVVECKSLDQGHDKKTDILYKISALQKDLGLRVTSFLLSTSTFLLDKKGDINQHIASRAKELNTEVIHPSDLPNFSKIISEKLHIGEPSK